MSRQESSTGEASRQASTGQPLAGLRVLEFCHTVMGPTFGLVLADLGAEVIKIEPAPDGDRTRQLKGFVIGAFPYLNRNKKSVGIDLKSERGRRILEDLVRDVDIVAENYAPGTAERLGLDYEDLSRINPRLIFCSLKGFLPGPYENRAALDEVVQHMAGLAYMTGPPGKPMRAGSSIVDMLGGVLGATAVLAALHERERTGRGQKIQSSLFESAVFLMGPQMGYAAMTGEEPLPMPVRQRAWAIYDTFDAKDGKVFLAITSDNHWRSFCTLFERPDLLDDPRFADNNKRVVVHDAIYPVIQEILKTHAADEIVALLAPLQVPVGAVRRPTELLDDPHLNASGGLLPVTMPNGKVGRFPALPVRFDGKVPGVRLDPPRLGEHTYEIMERCGYTREDIDALIADGIVR